MNDHQRKMARKAGAACGYADGGPVRGGTQRTQVDGLHDPDELALEEDEEERDRQPPEHPENRDLERFGKWAEDIGPEALSAYSARHRAKDKVVKKYGPTRPQRERAKAEETAERAQRDIDNQREQRNLRTMKGLIDI